MENKRLKLMDKGSLQNRNLVKLGTKLKEV